MELPKQFRPPISQTAHRAISCITKWLLLKKPVYYTVIADTKKESKRNWHCITCGKCTRPSATLQSFNIIWVVNYDSQVFQARKQTEKQNLCLPEQALGDGGQERLACCSPWCRKESDTTGQLNNNNEDRSTHCFFRKVIGTLQGSLSANTTEMCECLDL